MAATAAAAVLAAAGAAAELRIDVAGMVDRTDGDAVAGDEPAGNQEYHGEAAHPRNLAGRRRRVTTQACEEDVTTT